MKTASEYEHTPIKTESDYQATLAELEGLMMAEADTPAGDKLDVLVTLIEAYEAKQHESTRDNLLDIHRNRVG